MYDFQQNPLYNPALYPYMAQQNQAAQQPRREVVRVNGENGARAFPMGANSSALLLDESGTLVWLVTTDGAGYKTVSPFDITPHQAAPAPDIGSLEARIARLEEKVNAAASYPANAEQQRPRPDQASNQRSAKPQQSSGSIAADDAATQSSYDAGDRFYTSAWE